MFARRAGHGERLRAEQPPAAGKDGIDRNVLHAVVRAHRRIVAGAIEGRLEYFAPAVQFEFVPVERIVEQDQRFAEADGDMHGHGDRCDNDVALIDKVNELPEREVPRIPRTAASAVMPAPRIRYL